MPGCLARFESGFLRGCFLAAATQIARNRQNEYGKIWKNTKEEPEVVIGVGIVCFVLGANVGFVLAGLMRAAKEPESRPKD